MVTSVGPLPARPVQMQLHGTRVGPGVVAAHQLREASLQVHTCLLSAASADPRTALTGSTHHGSAGVLRGAGHVHAERAIARRSTTSTALPRR